MTRSEFDQKVRELKTKKSNAIREIAAMQAEVKEEIASKHRQIEEIRKEICKLNQSLQGFHQRRAIIETEWGKIVNDFIRENEPNTTSNLAEATTLNIVYELRRRGFDGIVSKIDKETGIDEFYDLQKQFGHHNFQDDATEKEGGCGPE